MLESTDACWGHQANAGTGYRGAFIPLCNPRSDDIWDIRNNDIGILIAMQRVDGALAGERSSEREISTELSAA